MLKEKLDQIKAIETRAAISVTEAEEAALEIVLEAEKQTEYLKKKAREEGAKKAQTIKAEIKQQADTEITRLTSMGALRAEELRRGAQLGIDRAVTLILSTITKGLVD